MIRSQPRGCFLRPDLGDVGHVAGNAALHDELAVDLDLGKELLHLDGKVLAVLLGVTLLDRHPGPVVVLVKGVAEQDEEEQADDQEEAS